PPPPLPFPYPTLFRSSPVFVSDNNAFASADVKGGTMRFTDKVAVITAFANGIGRATADIMAREGAVVVGVDNHQGRLDEAVAALDRKSTRLNSSHLVS